MNDVTGMSGATSTQPTPPPAAAAKLPALDELRRMRVSALQKLCKDHGLPFVSKTKKGDLVKLLDSKARGGDSGRFVAGKTLCKYCKARVRVVGTKRSPEYVIRKLRCEGRRGHRYSHYEKAGG